MGKGWDEGMAFQALEIKLLSLFLLTWHMESVVLVVGPPNSDLIFEVELISFEKPEPIVPFGICKGYHHY